MTYTKRERGIVRVTPPRTLQPGDLDAVLLELDAELSRGRPYVLLIDLSRAAVPDARQRQRLAKHMQDNDAAIRRWVLGLGVILTSPVARGVVTAIFWIAPPPVPHRIFTRASDAQAWAESLTRDTDLRDRDESC